MELFWGFVFGILLSSAAIFFLQKKGKDRKTILLVLVLAVIAAGVIWAMANGLNGQ